MIKDPQRIEAANRALSLKEKSMDKALADYVILIDREKGREYPYQNIKEVAKHLKVASSTLNLAMATHWISPRYQLLFPNKPRSPIPLGRIGGTERWTDIVDLWEEQVKKNPSTKFSVNAVYKEVRLAIKRGYCEFEYQSNRYCLLDKNLEPITAKLLPDIAPEDDLATIIAKVKAKAIEFRLSPYVVALYSINRNLFYLPDALLNELYLNH